MTRLIGCSATSWQTARWPIGHDEIRPWYARAADYLLCGNDAFSIPYKRKLSGGLTLDFVERWARESKLILEHRDRLLGSGRIKLSLKSTVTNLNLSADGQRVESLDVSTPAGACRVKARRIVLAMGGVETTRLLLRTQQRWPRHFGEVDGPLGRYYMGHIAGKIASIVLNDPDSIDDLDFKLDESGAYRRRRFMLTADAQLQHKVLNTAFWPDNPSFYDPSHIAVACFPRYFWPWPFRQRAGGCCPRQFDWRIQGRGRTCWQRTCGTPYWARRAARRTSTGFCATVLSKSPRSQDSWFPIEAANMPCPTRLNTFRTGTAVSSWAVKPTHSAFREQ